jgi:hypothetical protein
VNRSTAEVLGDEPNGREFAARIIGAARYLDAEPPARAGVWNPANRKRP